MEIKYSSLFFQKNQNALEFLIENRIISRVNQCLNCLGFFSLELKSSFEDKTEIYYRCNKKSCRKRISLYKELFKGCRLELFELLYLVYSFIINTRNYTYFLNSGISESTYIRYKDKIIELFNKYSEYNFEKLGGQRIRVQLDETVISRGVKIRSPTSADDEIRNTTWLFGGIDENFKSKFFLKVVPNRKAATLEEVIKEYVLPGSILVTDGYPSYPIAARNLNMVHCVVNHTEGFKNLNGDHTNNIENLWSHLKLVIASKYGVMKHNIKYLLYEFEFRKRYLDYQDKNNITTIFLEILKLVFN